jgi:hypothetical protein
MATTTSASPIGENHDGIVQRVESYSIRNRP